MTIYYIYALTLFSQINVSSVQIMSSLYALQLGAKPLAVGLLAATFSLFPMLLGVAAGKLVDRHGGRWPMTFGAIASTLGLLIPFLFPTLTALYITGTLTGLAVIFFNLATQNLVGLLSTPETRASYFSNYMLANSLAQFLGPTLGGFLVEHSAHPTIYMAGMMLVPISMLLVLGKTLPGGTAPAAGHNGGGGIRAMLTDHAVRRALVTGSLLNAGLNLFQVYMPVYAHSIGLTASAIGMVMAMNAAATFLVRFALPKLLKKYSEQRLLAYAFFVGAAGLTLTPFLHHGVLLGMTAFMFGLGMGCGQPIVIMMMFTTSRDGRSGEALGLKFAVNQLTKLVSPILFGMVASFVGIPPTFWLNASIMIAGGLMSRPSRAEKAAHTASQAAGASPPR